MSSPSDDDADSELSRYAPKWPRERPATPDAERLRSSIARWSTESHQNRQIRSLRPEPLPEPPARREDWLLPLVGRSVKVAAFAVLVALLAIFGKSLLEGVSPLNSGSQTKQVSEPSDRLTANNASTTNRALVPAAGIAAALGAAPSATAQAQAPLSSGQRQQAALRRRFTLNLSGMDIKNVGWQPLQNSYEVDMPHGSGLCSSANALRLFRQAGDHTSR